MVINARHHHQTSAASASSPTGTPKALGRTPSGAPLIPQDPNVGPIATPNSKKGALTEKLDLDVPGKAAATAATTLQATKATPATPRYKPGNQVSVHGRGTTKVSGVVTAVHSEPEHGPGKTLYNVTLDDNREIEASVSADDDRLREDTCSGLALPGTQYQVRLAHEVFPTRTAPAPEIEMATPAAAATGAPTQPAGDSASTVKPKPKPRQPRQPRQRGPKKGANEPTPAPADGPSAGAATAGAAGADDVAAGKRKLAESEGDKGDGASALDGLKRFKLESADGATIYSIHNNQTVNLITNGGRVEVDKLGAAGDATVVNREQVSSGNEAALWPLLGAAQRYGLPLQYASYLPSPLNPQQAAFAAAMQGYYLLPGTSAAGGGAGGYPLQLPANNQSRAIMPPPASAASGSNANAMQTRLAYAEAGQGFAGDDQRWATNGGPDDQQTRSESTLFKGTRF